MGVMLSLDRGGPARDHHRARHARRPGGQARNLFHPPVSRPGYVGSRGEDDRGSLVAMRRDQASAGSRLLARLTRTVLARRNRPDRDAAAAPAPPATPSAGPARGPSAGRAPAA
jgi:hypothetical protein